MGPEEKKKQHAIPEITVDTELLHKELRKAEIGEVVTYEKLSAVIGRDVRTCRHLLYSARRKATREEGFLFEAVTDVGLKRLDNVGIIGTGKDKIKRIRGLARRGLRNLSLVQESRLSHEQRTDYLFTSSMLGALEGTTKPGAQRALRATVDENQEKLAMAKALEVFQGKK